MRAVDLKSITFSYDERNKIFHKASFEAEYGEISLVSGYSGEGKSTLISIISGIIPNITYGSIEGEVLIDGQSIKNKKMGDVCRKVGIVMQNAEAQIVNKYVEDEVAFACENLSMPSEKIERQIQIVLSLMGLNRKDLTRTLSGGQKQRLITASTLAMGQKILILDEPLANLDKAGSEKLMGVLKSLAKSGYCIIIVEHRLDVVLPYVDRVWHVGNKAITEVNDKEKYLLSQTMIIEDEVKSCPSNNVLFKLNNVSYSIKGNDILSNVSFTINKGERVVLLGENGVGKTTLLRIISRLQKCTSGCVEQFINPRFDKKIYSKKEWFKKVGIVYQNPDYQLFMSTVRSEIAFTVKDDNKIESILESFNLKEIANRHPQSLSEGQKRRLTIAVVVAQDPDVLILDEPTVGQDYKGLRELVQIVNNLHEINHKTIITITHDARCARALCDKAVILENNSTVKVGGKDLVDTFFSI